MMNGLGKKSVKKIVHDKYIVMLLILAIMVTVVMVFVEYKYESNLSAEASTDSKNSYEVAYDIDLMDDEEESKKDSTETDNTYEEFDAPQISGNIYMSDYSLYLDDTFDWLYVNVFLLYQETPLEELDSGRYPTVEEIDAGEKYIVIGSSWLPFVTYNGDDMYLGIEGEKYQIIGVLKDTTISNDDSRVYMFYDSLSEENRQEIISYMYEGYSDIIYKSIYKSEEYDEYDVLSEWVSSEFPDLSYSLLDATDEDDDVELDEITTMIYELSKYMSILVYIFGIVSCFMVSKIWSKRKTKELMVRMALGESKIRIGGGFCISFFAMLVAGTALAATLVFVASRFGVLNISMSDIDYKGMGIQLLFIYIFTVITPLLQIKRLSPSQGLQRV